MNTEYSLHFRPVWYIGINMAPKRVNLSLYTLARTCDTRDACTGMRQAGTSGTAVPNWETRLGYGQLYHRVALAPGSTNAWEREACLRERGTYWLVCCTLHIFTTFTAVIAKSERFNYEYEYREQGCSP